MCIYMGIKLTTQNSHLAFFAYTLQNSPVGFFFTKMCLEERNRLSLLHLVLIWDVIEITSKGFCLLSQEDLSLTQSLPHINK